MLRLNSAILTPVKSYFWHAFHSKPFSPVALCDDFGIKRRGIFLRIFWYIWKICRLMSTYSNAHAKVKNWIFDVQFPGKWFGLDIISNDFWSSTIWASQILLSLTKVKTSKIPEFNLIMLGSSFCRNFLSKVLKPKK